MDIGGLRKEWWGGHRWFKEGMVGIGGLRKGWWGGHRWFKEGMVGWA